MLLAAQCISLSVGRGPHVVALPVKCQNQSGDRDETCGGREGVAPRFCLHARDFQRPVGDLLLAQAGGSGGRIGDGLGKDEVADTAAGKDDQDGGRGDKPPGPFEGGFPGCGVVVRE